MIRASLKWMYLIIGTTIGAGYASGRELWEFFGHGSGLAIILFAIFFTISCIVIMNISYRQKSTDYVPVLKDIVGSSFTKIFDFLIFVYLLTTTIVMIAGSGATGQAFNIPYLWGVLLIVCSIILLFMGDIHGVLTINQFLIPLLIIGLLYVLTLFTYDENLSLFSHWHEQSNWMSAFPFTALNILPLIAVIGAIGHQVKTKREIWIACVGSGLILGVLSYIYNNNLIQIEDEIFLYEIPLFAIIKNYSLQMIVFMTVILWFAIFTTAVANTLGIVTRLKQYVQQPLWMLATYTLLAIIPLSMFGFSTLIRYIYPIYGILNLYVLTCLLMYPLRGCAKQWKN